MSRIFVVRTDGRAGIWESLQAGKARLGWSYHDRLNLAQIQEKVQSGIPLDTGEKKAWKGKQFLYAVQPGDYLIYTQQPGRGFFVIVQVSEQGGDYDFAPETDSLEGDFRSYRRCTLVTEQPVSKADKIVHPAIRHKLGLRGRIYRLLNCNDLFQALLLSVPEAGEVEGSKNDLRFGRIAEKLRERLPSLIQLEFPTHAFSRRFAKELFEAMDYRVDVQEGPSEQGSDLIVTIGSPLINDELLVGVQMFSYTDRVAVPALKRKLEQLVDGWEDNALDYGVLLTTGECGQDGKTLIETHNHRHPDKLVRLLEGRDVASLVLRYLGAQLGVSDQAVGVG